MKYEARVRKLEAAAPAAFLIKRADGTIVSMTPDRGEVAASEADWQAALNAGVPSYAVRPARRVTS